MPCFYMGLNCGPNMLSRPFFTFVVNGGHSQPAMMQANYRILVFKSLSQAFTFVYSLPKVQCAATLQLTMNEDKPPSIGPHPQPQLSLSSSGHIAETSSSCKNEENQAGKNEDGVCSSSSQKVVVNKDYKEMERRKKIGQANKGKTPWNKGKKHSAETRERIKRRTIEALRDPKVRRKMSECPRAHSEQSKARIGIALRRIWRERLKWKMLQEKCCLGWAKSIAEEARKGGHGQEELEWDSYDKLKADIIRKQLQRAAEKAKVKEMAKVRAERMAMAKANKLARLARERKKKEEAKEEAKVALKQKIGRKLGEKEDLAISKELKLKARLSKFRHRQRHQKCGESLRDAKIRMEPVVEKWDLEFVKRERMRRDISLADQIRAANNKRAQVPAKESQVATPLSDSLKRPS